MGVWIEGITAGAAWTSIMVTILIFLHTQRIKAFNRLRNEVIGLINENRNEHDAQRKQVQDIVVSMASNYVRHSQLERAITEFNASLTEARKEIGKIEQRIDELFRSVEWRRSP